MARKRKSSTREVRNRHITVWMSPSEQEYLRDRAGSLSLSEYFLNAGLGHSIPQRRKRQSVPEVNRSIYLELSKISQALQCGALDPELLNDLMQQIQILRLQLINANLEEEP
jgi:hypothetical protein